MDWHIFPEGRRRYPAPAFRLPSSQGGMYALDDQRGWGNMVLFFSHGSDCTVCSAALREFALRRFEYGAQDAKVFPIVPQTAEQVAQSDYPFPILSDPERRVYRQYQELLSDDANQHVMLFVLDRYGAPYAGITLAEPDSPELHAETLDWLDFIGLQCPE